MKETREKLVKKMKNALERVAKYITNTSKYYVEDKNGEYGLVDDSTIYNIQKEFTRLSEITREMKGNVDANKRETIEEIDRILNSINIEKLPAEETEKLLELAIKAIEENAVLNIESPTQKLGRGGLHGTVTFEGKKQGGVLTSKKDIEKAERISGNYVKEDDALNILKNTFEQIDSLSKNDITIPKEEIKKVIARNYDSLKRQCTVSAKKLPNMPKIKHVKKKRFFIGAYRTALLTTTAIALLSTISRGTNLTVGINELADNTTNIEKMIDELGDSIEESNGNLYVACQGAGEEANTIGRTDLNGDKEPEVIARDARLDNQEKLNEMKNAVQEEIGGYEDLQEPQNLDWLELQVSLYENYLAMLTFNQEINEKTNSYLNLWNDLNQEHIDKGQMSEEANDDHRKEIKINKLEIDENNLNHKSLEQSIEEGNRRKEFYEKISAISNLEEINEIEDVSETLYKFYNLKLCKNMSIDEFTKFLEDKDINLLSSFSKMNLKVENLAEFVSAYSLVENGYKEYLEKYCRRRFKTS